MIMIIMESAKRFQTKVKKKKKKKKCTIEYYDRATALMFVVKECLIILSAGINGFNNQWLCHFTKLESKISCFCFCLLNVRVLV